MHVELYGSYLSYDIVFILWTILRMFCGIYEYFVWVFFLLFCLDIWASDSMNCGNGRECKGTGTGEDASDRAQRPIPTGTIGGFSHRVIYPVTKADIFGTTLRAPVGEPGLMLVFNRYLKLFL